MERDGGFFAWEERELSRMDRVALDMHTCKRTAAECEAKGGPATCRFHGNVNYYTDQQNRITKEESNGQLAKFGVKPMRLEPFVSEGTYKSVCSKQLQQVIEHGVKGVSDKEYEDTCKAVSVVLEDLNKRFGTNVRIDFLVPASLDDVAIDDRMVGAASEVDHIWSDKTTLLYRYNPKQKYMGYCYGHNDARFPYDTIRHEVGHILTTKEVLTRYFYLVGLRNRENGVVSTRDELLKMTSRAAMDGGELEAIAELFARCTSPDYQLGDVPEDFEDLVFFNMLGIKEAI